MSSDNVRHQNAFQLGPWNDAISLKNTHSDAIHFVSDGLIPILNYSGQLLEFGMNRVLFPVHLEELLAELEIFVLDVGSDFYEVLEAIFCTIVPTIR